MKHEVVRVRRKIRMFGSDETWTDALERAVRELKAGWHVVEVDRTYCESDDDPHIALLIREDSAS